MDDNIQNSRVIRNTKYHLVQYVCICHQITESLAQLETVFSISTAMTNAHLKRRQCSLVYPPLYYILYFIILSQFVTEDSTIFLCFFNRQVMMCPSLSFFWSDSGCALFHPLITRHSLFFLFGKDDFWSAKSFSTWELSRIKHVKTLFGNYTMILFISTNNIIKPFLSCVLFYE